jgi:uncharacterized membrane protein
LVVVAVVETVITYRRQPERHALAVQLVQAMAAQETVVEMEQRLIQILAVVAVVAAVTVQRINIPSTPALVAQVEVA